MEEKRKWYQDSYGWKTWVVMLIGLLCFLGLIVLFIGLEAGTDYYEVKAFNRIHGTDYAWSEWFFAEETIKDYHLGTIENKKYNVDLNINK